MRNVRLEALVLGLILAGCGGAAATAPVAHDAAHHTVLRLFCMRNISNLEVREVDLHDGAEMSFIAPRLEDRRELRALIERFVAVDAEARVESPGSPAFGDPNAIIHHAHLTALETDGGVDLLVETGDGEIDAARAELREDARELAAAQCPLALQLVL